MPWQKRNQQQPPRWPEQPLEQRKAAEQRDASDSGDGAIYVLARERSEDDRCFDENCGERKRHGELGIQTNSQPPVEGRGGCVAEEVVLDCPVQDPRDAALMEL